MPICRRVLIANRGEIAVRVARTAREMGITTVGVYADADRLALHTRVVDEAVALDGIGPADSYLSVPKLLAIARSTGCDAVHPGYGFLSENAGFAQAVVDAGLCFVGPAAPAIAAMGEKAGARAAMQAAGVPVVPGGEASVASAAGVGFPLLVKASAGGGGRGMRVVRLESEFAAAVSAASAEALAAFGDGSVYVERLLEGARHVEVQILADAHGGCVSVGARECSVQRRHQKLVEESPVPHLPDATLGAMESAAVRAALAVKYQGAGTVEFLLAPDGSFFFIEMNTRIQVEHGVTEWVTGLDLVREQFRLAAGERVPAVPPPRGHAIEVRVIAEDPARGFLPSPGRIAHWRPPEGPGIRVDAGVAEGFVVPTEFDSLLAKLVVHGADREAARARLVRALGEFSVGGVPTTIELARDIVQSGEFAAGRVHTRWLDAFMETWKPSNDADLALLAGWALAQGRADAGAATVAAIPSPFATLGGWR